MEKDELSEKELENVIGGPFPSNKIPQKFKEIKEEKKDDELSMEELEKVYGGPIKAEDLSEEYKMGR